MRARRAAACATNLLDILSHSEQFGIDFGDRPRITRKFCITTFTVHSQWTHPCDKVHGKIETVEFVSFSNYLVLKIRKLYALVRPGGELPTSDHALPTAPDPGPNDPKNPLKMKNTNGIIIHLSRTTRIRHLCFTPPFGPRADLPLFECSDPGPLVASSSGPGPPDFVTELFA